MGLTSALNTSLNGLTLNETTIDVLGNNIANAGTFGFKASTVRFSTQLSRTLSVGSAPQGDSGGTNPRQIGLGAATSAITKDFTQGGITNSNRPSDLAIQGEGFFIVAGPEGEFYTRNGSFSKAADNRLVNPQGLLVQGYAVDSNFELDTTELSDLTIPVGDLNIAQQTENVAIAGALLTTGDAEDGTRGSLLLSEVLTDATTGNVIDQANAGTIKLVDLRTDFGTPDEAAPFQLGTLTFTPEKGGSELDAHTLEITATTTLQEFLDLIQNGLGIHTGGSIPNDESGNPPGISIVGGQIQIVGNRGKVNDFDLPIGTFTQGADSVDVAFTKTQSANGESTKTDFIVFDSLGQPVNVRISMVLEQKVPETVARYYIESFEDSRDSIAISSGEVKFGSKGTVIEGATSTFSLERQDTAAASPMQISLDFSSLNGITSSGSTLNADADGFPPGTLTNFVIDEQGVINGEFSNGEIRTLGQVVLARFRNPQGLLEKGEDTFSQGVTSGDRILGAPGSFGFGTIRGGALELSNTDIGRNLVDLIVAATNYRGNARVINSVQQLVDELLVLGR